MNSCVKTWKGKLPKLKETFFEKLSKKKILFAVLDSYWNLIWTCVAGFGIGFPYTKHIGKLGCN